MTLALFGVLFLLLFFEIPIAICLGITTLVGIMLSGVLDPSLITTTMVSSLDSFPMLCIPFFVLAGNLMAKGTMAQKLMNVSDVFFGRIKGSLAITTVVASAFFAALSGSAVATAAAIGGIMYPVMVEKKYEREFSGLLVASSGLLGPLIPPSILMIIYAVSANESISDLFVAGFIPGIMMAVAMIILIKLYVRKHGHEIIEDTDKRYTMKEKMATIWSAKWALLMPIIILGGIYSGIVTPTEAAIIASIYAILVGFVIERDLTFNDFASVVRSTVITAGCIHIITGLATGFGYLLNMNQIPTQLALFVTGLTSNPFIILLLINIFLLIVGCFMETAASIIILTPLLLPIAMEAGLSKISFGIMMCVNLVIGGITPPVGVNLFVAAQIGNLTIRDLMKYLPHFLIALGTVLLLLTYIPQISEFLPALLKD